MVQRYSVFRAHTGWTKSICLGYVDHSTDSTTASLHTGDQTLGRVNYKADKRRRELERQKKQEEKKQKRLDRKHNPKNPTGGTADGNSPPPEGPPQGESL